MSYSLTGIRADRAHHRGVILGLTIGELMLLMVFLILVTSTALNVRELQEARTLAVERTTAAAAALKEQQEIAALQEQAAVLQAQISALLNQNHDLKDKLRSELDAQTNANQSAAGREQMAAELVLAKQQIQLLRSELVNAQIASQQAAASAGAEQDRLATLLNTIRQANRLLTDQLAALAAKSKQDLAFAEGERAHMAAQLAQSGQDNADLRSALDEERRKLAQALDLPKNATQQQIDVKLAGKLGIPGSGPAHCWADADRKPEFMLNVTMFDNDMVTVGDVQPHAHADDRAWAILQNLSLGNMIPMPTMLAAIGPLRQIERDQKCVFAVKAVDLTDASDKLGYKQVMKQLGEVFYVSGGR